LNKEIFERWCDQFKILCHTRKGNNKSDQHTSRHNTSLTRITALLIVWMFDWQPVVMLVMVSSSLVSCLLLSSQPVASPFVVQCPRIVLWQTFSTRAHVLVPCQSRFHSLVWFGWVDLEIEMVMMVRVVEANVVFDLPVNAAIQFQYPVVVAALRFGSQFRLALRFAQFHSIA
jgi:hypothetical protein